MIRLCVCGLPVWKWNSPVLWLSLSPPPLTRPSHTHTHTLTSYILYTVLMPSCFRQFLINTRSVLGIVVHGMTHLKKCILSNLFSEFCCIGKRYRGTGGGEMREGGDEGGGGETALTGCYTRAREPAGVLHVPSLRYLQPAQRNKLHHHSPGVYFICPVSL